MGGNEPLWLCLLRGSYVGLQGVGGGMFSGLHPSLSLPAWVCTLPTHALTWVGKDAFEESSGSKEDVGG